MKDIIGIISGLITILLVVLPLFGFSIEKLMINALEISIIERKEVKINNIDYYQTIIMFKNSTNKNIPDLGVIEIQFSLKNKLVDLFIISKEYDNSFDVIKTNNSIFINFSKLAKYEEVELSILSSNPVKKHIKILKKKNNDFISISDYAEDVSIFSSYNIIKYLIVFLFIFYILYKSFIHILSKKKKEYMDVASNMVEKRTSILETNNRKLTEKILLTEKINTGMKNQIKELSIEEGILMYMKKKNSKLNLWYEEINKKFKGE